MKKAKLITSSAVVMTMVMSSIVPAFAYSKEETVYSKLKTNGTEKTTVVSEHLFLIYYKLFLLLNWQRQEQLSS